MEKVLGVHWRNVVDSFVFDTSIIFQIAKTLEPTKNSIISTVGCFYDPIWFQLLLSHPPRCLFKGCVAARFCGIFLSLASCYVSGSLQQTHYLDALQLPRCYLSASGEIYYLHHILLYYYTHHLITLSLLRCFLSVSGGTITSHMSSVWFL